MSGLPSLAPTQAASVSRASASRTAVPRAASAAGTTTSFAINADGSTTSTVTDAQGRIVSRSTTEPVNQAQLAAAFAQQADKEELAKLTAARGSLNILA